MSYRECSRCNAPAMKGRSMCLEHYTNAAEERKAKRRQLLRDGICTQCSKNPLADGRTRCSDCIQKAKDKRLSERSFRVCTGCHKPNNHPYFVTCDVCRDVKSEYVSLRGKALAKSGLCKKCRNPVPNSKRVHCDECLANRRKLYQDKLESGLCAGCSLEKDTDKSYCRVCLESIVSKTKKRVNDRKKRVMDAYGGECKCCGESDLVYLNIDHIHNDGALERKFGIKGDSMYRSLEKRNYPQGYQVLCFNCNLAKHYQGCCSHNIKGKDDDPKTGMDDFWNDTSTFFFTDPVFLSGCG